MATNVVHTVLAERGLASILGRYVPKTILPNTEHNQGLRGWLPGMVRNIVYSTASTELFVTPLGLSTPQGLRLEVTRDKVALAPADLAYLKGKT